MSALTIGGIVFVFLSLAISMGMMLSLRLPHHHLGADSKDTIKLATAVVGTLSALALGFLIASAKTTFDVAEAELRTSVAQVVLLDRVMAHYGAETAGARQALAQLVEARLQQSGQGGGEIATAGIEPVQDELRSLIPEVEAKRLLQSRALEVSGKIAEAHWLLVEQEGEEPPWAFLAILVFWLALLFFTFGLLSPRNTTVVSILLVCALSVAGAVFLIIDMAHPYLGFIRVSDAPLRMAPENLGRT